MTIPHEGVIVLLFQDLEQIEVSIASWGTNQKIQTSYILFWALELDVIKSGPHRYENRESKPRSNRGPTIRSAYSGSTSKCALHPIARFFVI